MCSVQCSRYSVQCVMRTEAGTVCSVQFALQQVQCEMSPYTVMETSYAPGWPAKPDYSPVN